MPTRRRASKRGALPALVVISVLLHAGAGLVAIALGGGESRGAVREVEVDERASEPQCELMAGLAASARAGLCAVGFGDPQRACAQAALRGLELDLIQCRGLAGPQPFLAPGEVEMALVDPADIPEVEELPEPEPEIDPRGQIVEITEPEDARRPDRARFLSEFDSVVDRETVARGSTDEMVARPRQEARQRQARDERGEGPDSETGDGGRRARELALSDPPPGARSGLEKLRKGGQLPARGGPARDQADRAGGRRGGAPDLRPSKELLARVMEGTGGSVDRLDGVEQGESTALNSVQFKHASFFNRIKREVAQHWEPGRVLRRHDPEGKTFGLRDRITVVRVWLTPQGSLARIAVMRKSGVDVLDDEAVRAFRAAQPFPNPPSALVDERSKELSFEFGFHFQIGGRPDRWRIFRNL